MTLNRFSMSHQNFFLNLWIGKLSKNNKDLTLNLAGTGCSKKKSAKSGSKYIFCHVKIKAFLKETNVI